ncbi:MAG: hypothetical protein MST00_06735 [Tenericutes bacterium]|nr:hypothetical protein [Mycoplasmatota bacterium]
MERKNINEIVIYYLKKIKEWRDKLIKDEINLYDHGYINDNEKYGENSNKTFDIITHYSINGQQLMTDMLVSMISKEIEIDCGCTDLADAINDYVVGDLTLDSMYTLLHEFAIMGNNCTQEEVDNWDKLYAELKEKDKSYVELEGVR